MPKLLAKLKYDINSALFNDTHVSAHKIGSYKLNMGFLWEAWRPNPGE